MKKITFLFIIVTFILTVTADAQIKKGSLFLGGNIGGSTQKTKRDGTEISSHNGLYISPVFGKAIKENLILGVDAGFGLSENNSSGSNEQRNNSYGAGIFIRKYKPIVKSGFSMFLQGRFAVNYSSNEYNTTPPYFDKSKAYGIGVSIYPGISYTISKRLQLETGFNELLSLGYFAQKREVSGIGISSYTEKTNGIGISSSLNNLSSLYLGFRVLINN